LRNRDVGKCHVVFDDPYRGKVWIVRVGWTRPDSVDRKDRWGESHKEYREREVSKERRKGGWEKRRYREVNRGR